MAGEVRGADSGASGTAAPTSRGRKARFEAVVLGLLLGLFGLMLIGGIGVAVAFYLFVSECSC